MDWQLLTQHLVSGYIPVIPALLVYFIVLNMSRKRQTIAHIIMSYVFCFYLVGILTMTGIWWIKPFSPRLVWLPFVDMIRGPVDTVLNVFLFIPLGFFLPMLYKWYDRIGKVALTGFLLSLSVECVQMFGCGSTDVNDLITNTVGACIGYYIFRLLSKGLRGDWCEALKAVKIQDCYEVLIFYVYSLLTMALVQPVIFHKLF